MPDSRWRPAEPAPEPATGELVIRPEIPALPEAMELYAAVGWGAYTEDPSTLERSFAGSAHVVTARRDGLLLGVARVIGDGATIVYLQDVLVRPEEHRSGLGRRLVEAASHLSPRCASRCCSPTLSPVSGPSTSRSASSRPTTTLPGCARSCG